MGKLTSTVLIVAQAIILLSIYPDPSQSFDKIRSQQSRSIDPETQRKIDDFIEQTYSTSSQKSGVALAIVRGDGELLYTTGYGPANIEKGIDNGNTTQFMVGSVTKSFTATLAVKLLHEKFPQLGEAALDTPIRTLLPQVNFTLNDRFRSEYATFRDLLAHRICIQRDDLALTADPIERTEEINYRLRYSKEICGFRKDWEYNNQVYALAGELLGILAGKPYEDAIQDLLNDIGLSNTTFLQKEDDFEQMPYRALPYFIKDNETHPLNQGLITRLKPINACGGLYLIPNEMARYMQFHLNKGTIDGLEIVPREVMEWLYKPSIMRPEFGFKDSDEDLVNNHFAYGLAFMLSAYDGWEHTHHTGGMPPYFSLMSLYPGKKLGIFTSTNITPMPIDHQALHAFLFEILRGAEDPLEKAMKVEKVIREKQAKINSEAGKEFEAFYKSLQDKGVSIVGKYGSGSSGDLEISEKFNEETNQTGLYIVYGPWYRGWLEQEPDGLFHINYDTDIVQDDYVLGFSEGRGYVGMIDNDTLTLFVKGAPSLQNTFKLGVKLDLLPPVPWSPESCGPEDNNNIAF